MTTRTDPTTLSAYGPRCDRLTHAQVLPCPHAGCTGDIRVPDDFPPSRFVWRAVHDNHDGSPYHSVYARAYTYALRDEHGHVEYFPVWLPDGEDQQ